MNNLSMKSFLSKYHLQLFFFAVALESLAANFAHPITPTLIQNLQLPDYSFGMLYAGMAFTNFLFSPFWAKQVTRMGSSRVLGICCVGYGIGQLLFAIMKTLPTIMLARLLSGFFVGGIMVSFLTYIIHTSTMENRGRYLALSATFTTVFAAFGYLIGGFAGVVSIPLTFALQSGVLILCGMLFAICLREDREVTGRSVSIWKEANPFQAFLDARRFMTLTFAVLFFAVFLTSTATTAYDQNFNYFIKDQFHFNSSYNGMLKAVVGFISLIANTTICVWIMKRTNVKKSVIYVLGGAGVTLIAITMLEDILPFILINIIFFALNAIYIPLLQDLCASASSAEHSSMVMGFYNAMKSLGMIAGALFAGFIYAAGPRLSFLYAGIFFLISMLAAIWYYRRSGRNRENA